jgi:AmmeMemoRadiSam system protein A
VSLLLELAKGQAGLKMQHLQYQNSSASVYGDTKRVVGYHSIMLYEDAAAEAFTLQAHEKQELLKLARNAIKCKLLHQPANPPKPDSNSPNLLRPCGAFVSLHKHGKLRGCIGRFSTSKPLYQTVYDMALAAAFEDTRFDPLKLDELENVEIELSVLTPMQRLHDSKQLVLGRDGIYIKKAGHSGTFLPQVATNTGWTLEEFLGHCSADKAGLGWDGWRNAELYTYQALVFAETDSV